MSHQTLENDYVEFHFKEMERDVNLIRKNAETIFKILDEYEKTIDAKFGQ